MVVCGKETIIKSAASTILVALRGSVLEIDPDQFFTMTLNSDTDESCLQNPEISLLDDSCVNPAAIGHSIIEGKVTIDTSVSFQLKDFCLKIETMGKVVSTQGIQIEITGSEKISLSSGDEVSKLLEFSYQFVEINL